MLLVMLFLFGGDKKRCGIRSSHSYAPLIVKSVIVVRSHWILSPTGCETSTLRKAPNRKVGFNSFFLVTESISFFFLFFLHTASQKSYQAQWRPWPCSFQYHPGCHSMFQVAFDWWLLFMVTCSSFLVLCCIVSSQPGLTFSETNMMFVDGAFKEVCLD